MKLRLKEGHLAEILGSCTEDVQNFPGASRPLAMSFAAKKGWVAWL